MPDTRSALESKSRPDEARWLVLLHRIPPRPDYLRVKIGRRLREAGAVALRPSVYVLPVSPAARSLLASLTRAIVAGGGQATACEARFVEGLSDDGIESMFRAGRDAEYAKVATEARKLAASLAGRRGRTSAPGSAAAALNRLRRRFDAITARDRFGARGRDGAAGLLSLAEDRLQGVEAGGQAEPAPLQPRGATWVTRVRVMVDRMGSAWLIRRFIDPGARFKFVGARGYRPLRGELRFDMAGAEFTHEGERCTFEVLLERFRLADPALRSIAELVHDLDLEDGRHGRPETSGLGRMVVGIALATPDDATRLAQSAIVFDGLYESFRKLGR
jgi:hypothetical protein